MLRTTTLVLAILLSLATPSAVAAEYPRAELLVEASHLTSGDVGQPCVILDARRKADYEAAHIPGARWVDHDEWSKGFGDGDDVENWTKRIGKLGLERDSPVVVYDDNRSKDAARIWWILRYWGLTDVRLLNGGWRTWTSAEMPVQSKSSTAPPTTTPKLVPAPARLATKKALLASLEGGQLQIVDARSEDEHCGIEARSNNKAGAIPGAAHLEWLDLIDEDTHRFKSADDLKALLSQAGIVLDRPTATHCQSGGRASVMAFGLELMGAKDVSNYYLGWSEWGNAGDTPVEPGRPSSTE